MNGGELFESLGVYCSMPIRRDIWEIIIAMIAGITLGGTAMAQTDEPAVADRPADTSQVHLQNMQRALSKATAALRRARTANKGGFVEEARIDLERVNLHVERALAYVSAHPEMDREPIPAWSGGGLAYPTPLARGDAPAPNVRTALTGVRTAWNELMTAPGGDLGGLRATMFEDLERAAFDLASAIDIAGARRGGTTQ